MEYVSTLRRLDRASRTFEPGSSTERVLASPTTGVPVVVDVTAPRPQERSLGDAMNKLILVETGQLDLEGGSGGWLILPNHLVFIPAERAFTVRASTDTTLRVAHLAPADAPWPHHGCWITVASPLSREMLAHALRWTPEDVGADQGPRSFFRTLSHLCIEWFSNPRMLWMPAARTPEMRRAILYIRDHLAGARLEGACAASGLSARTFQRRCEQELGFSFRSLLREIRMMRAMELLATRGQPVAAIAQATGFRSPAAFATSFTERFGLSPSEYGRLSASASAACGI